MKLNQFDLKLNSEIEHLLGSMIEMLASIHVDVESLSENDNDEDRDRVLL